jgi:DNA-binding TFAR19-related protein (PDSD5 family)
LSTKLSIDDYNAFLILTKIEYEPRLIKGECIWELLRVTICHILNQVHKQPEYLKQQQQEQVQNNQQLGFHNQVTLQFTAASHQQVSKLSQTKDIPAAKIRLASMQTNRPTYTDNVLNDLLNFKDSTRFSKQYVK